MAFILMIFLVLSLLAPKYIASKYQSVIIERQLDLPDRILDFKNVGIDRKALNESCIDPAKKTIASRHWQNKLSCFTEEELKTLGNELCMHGRKFIKPNQHSIRLCKVQSILEIAVWDLQEWKHFRYDDDPTLRNEINFAKGILNLSIRSKWDGMLIRIFVRCAINYDVRCFTLKFTGPRKYPLDKKLEDILQEKERKTTSVASKEASPKRQSPVTYIVVTIIAVIVCVVLSFFLIKRRQRNRRRADSRKRRAPSFRDEAENSAKMVSQLLRQQDKVEYAEPRRTIPMYRELQPLYDNEPDRLKPVEISVYDTPKHAEGQWPPTGYRVPSSTAEVTN